MSTRKEEERNEKIIRGLMKLPPNRKCINCNSLGPQYVCTNFWTFICIACSGIHREFTHRVKSVSMSKFTSQEVEALQSGGNQRAREIFLRDWDMQRHRLPDSSNADRIREFIKNVYVDRKYAGGKTYDKPPRDMQSQKNYEEDNRRASSYHSYSQSPPYEYQYEDRRYGKPTVVLSRKPGSDRGHYEGKISSFIYSPGRSGEHIFEDRFANEGSGTRVSDYSFSSAGDPFRFDAQSPNFQRDARFSSPPVHPVRDILVEDVQRRPIISESEANAKTDRTASSGSFGSFDSNSMSLKSVNSGSLVDIVIEPEQSIGTQQSGTSPFSSLPQSSASTSFSNQAPFNSSFTQPPSTTSIPSIDLFGDFTHQCQSTTYSEQKPSAIPIPANEGWATFDLPQHATPTDVPVAPAAPAQAIKHIPTVILHSGDGLPKGKVEALSSVNNSLQWPSVQTSTAHEPFSSMSYQWHGGAYGVQASNGPTSSQPWNAFDDSTGNLSQASFEDLPQQTEPQVPVHMPRLPSTPTTSGDQYKSSYISEDFSKDGFQRSTIEDRVPVPSLLFNSVATNASFPPSLPLGGMPTHGHELNSTNPFDLPYDSDLEPNNMVPILFFWWMLFQFLDMSSLQAVLPNSALPDFLGGLTPQPWFPQSSVMPYIPSVPQGGLAYMPGQAPTSQLPNLSSQGPVGSLGGNPFA
ncbi:putative ADP-ribosylation factor GTPase-activating protein AGD14 isoform X2 [Tasmannia lanceolata]|uniref:putative ADP-ribosylation factor GTPase-activating protein AGD14 isoform X2 n=1 Tax=Tasmannia lanceolata TaxID=3420 RepID=UPI0040630D32